jgi:periplasmic copper chaperone A
MYRTISRLLALVAGLAVILAAGALPASAHVIVDPGQAAQGSFDRLDFRMPTERAANAIKLKVTFPSDPPLAYVLAKPHAGWRIKIEKRTYDPPIVIDGKSVSAAVSSITWTAESHKSVVKPDEFEEFTVLAGYMPKVAQLYFPAYQTYSDGVVVNWDQIPSSTNPTPANPAPSLKLTPAGQTAPSSFSRPGSGASVNVKAAGVSEGSGTGNTVTLAALIAALVVGGGAFVIRKRRRSESSGV